MKIFLILGLIVTFVTGCGFKGPLYLSKSIDNENIKKNQIESTIIESQNKQ